MAQGHANTGIDVVIVALYLGMVLLVGLWKPDRGQTAKQHFLASASAAWPRIGFALYASTLGATSLVGITGTAYANGISVFAYEWMAALVLPVFCTFILPTYLTSRVFTVPEFLELRYGRFVRTYVAGFSICLDIFLDGAGGLFAGSILFQILAPDWPLWIISTLLAVLSGAFLLLGGLRAVILVEAIQGIIVVAACACLAAFTFHAADHAAGGIGQVWAHIDPSKLKLIMPASDPNIPWTGLVTGVPLIGFYYWCTNQTMVQRVLSARSLDDGRWGSLLGGALKLTTLFLVVLPGTAAVLIFPHLGAPDQVFSHIVFGILPHGLIGMVIAVCLVSILSSLASLYNATSTLLTMDFIRRLRPALNDAQLIRVSRGLTVVVMILSVLIAQQIGHFRGTLWQYLQAVMSYFVPPVAAVFLAGFFWTRANATGAACGLIVGTAASFAGFFAIEVYRAVPLHFLLAAVVIFAIALAAVAFGSWFGTPEPLERITPLMFTPKVWRAETERLKGVAFYRNYRILSLGLVALTLTIVAIFH